MSADPRRFLAFALPCPSRLNFAARLCGLAVAGLASCAQAAPAFDSDSPWMLGDWAGKRTELSQQGYDFKLDYTAEMGSNLHGGYSHDNAVRYSDQYALGAHLDLQKILGWQDAEFQLTVNNRNGDNISNDRVSDPRTGTLSSSQEVWGRGSVTRLTQLWYQQKFLDQALSVKLGRFNQGEDFGSFPCDFQNLSLCGHWKLGENQYGSLALELSGDYTRAKNLDTGEALPRIAPLRLNSGLLWELDKWQARIDVEHASSQRRVPDNETGTDGYTTLGASAGYKFNLGGSQWLAFVNGENLTNQTVRYASSILRDIAPAPGRSVEVGLRTTF